MEVLNLKDISKKFDDRYVVKNVNITIKKNTIYGLVGSNGAGKTTIMKMIAGLIKETSGEIKIFGNYGKDLYKSRKYIGTLIESPGTYMELNAYQNIEYYQRLFNVKADKKKINKLLEIVGLEDVQNKKVTEYSLGMKQRLGIAITLISNPKFLLLDEPTNGLDPIGIISIRNLILHLVREKDLTVLISSHILNELEQLADCFGFIHKGNLLKEIYSTDIEMECKKEVFIKVQDNQKLNEVLSNMNLSSKTKYIKQEDKYMISIGSMPFTSLVNNLIQSGVVIEDIGYKKPSLEEYYMNLVGGKND